MKRRRLNWRAASLLPALIFVCLSFGFTTENIYSLYSSKTTTVSTNASSGGCPGPVITSPVEEIIVSTSVFSCVANFEIPLPDIAEGTTCTGAQATFYKLVLDGTVFANGSLNDQDVVNLPIGEIDLIRCAEDDCGNECCISTPVIVVDNIAPAAVCNDQIIGSLGGGDIANGIEGIFRLFPDNIDEGSFDNCGELTLEIRRNKWRDFTCHPDSNRWSPWGAHADFYCCDQAVDIIAQLRVTDQAGNEAVCETNIIIQDQLAPFCYPYLPESFPCQSPPDGFPEDIEAAYATDFTATSTLMSSLFNSATGTDNCAVDTIAERAPLIQLNDCGSGTITRFFEAWQARPDADLSDGIQIDEVLRSTNECSQVISIYASSSYEIAFPADAETDCTMPDPSAVEITADGCDVFGINTSVVASYPPEGDECYQLAVVYDVLNWCEWDGEFEGYEVPRITEEDGDILATGFSVEAAERPILLMTSDIGPDDEDCDGELSPAENGLDDATDQRYYLTVDRNHPDEDGDSSLPDETFDNVADTPAGCIPADANDIRAYSRFRYTQMVKVFNPSDLSVVVPDFGGPTENCPNLAIGEFGDDDGDCEEAVEISFSLGNSCEVAVNTSGSNGTLLSASLDLFAGDANADGEINADEFTAEENALDLIQANEDGSFTFAGSFPVSTLSFDSIVHALQVAFEDACGNQTTTIIEFEVVDCKAPAPICINGLLANLSPNIDGICSDTIHARTFEGSPISDCTGQGPAVFLDRPVVTSYAIYLAEDIEANPDFEPSPSDSLLVLLSDSEETTVVNIVAFDEEGNYDFCETYILVQQNVACGGDEPIPYCFAPDDAFFSCSSPPAGLPEDLEAAYSSDPGGTSVLMNSLFGAPYGTIAIDTVVELMPLIQLNDCGAGTITRYFEGWQALPDADLSDGLQIDEVIQTTNSCAQEIIVLTGGEFTMAFPADGDLDCGAAEQPEVEITSGGCDVFSVITSIGESYPATGDECYQLAITYDVINWCYWDGEYEGYEIPRLTEEDGTMLATGFSVEAAERSILRMTSGIGPDDEDCDGILDFFENDGNDAQDIRFYLTIDRNHPDVDGDSALPDELFDNVAGTPADCIPADNNGLRNYGRYRYTQIVRVYNATDLSIAVEDYGGPTPSVPDLLPGQFADEDGDCEATVEVSFSVSNTCELVAQTNSSYGTLTGVMLDAFAVDTNEDGAIDTDEFEADEDVTALAQDNSDGTITISGNFPLSTVSNDNIVHAFLVSIEDACGNSANHYVTFEVIDRKAPAPICLSSLPVTLQPQADGSCAATVQASDFEGSPIYDCTGQGPDTQLDLPRVRRYAIYRTDEVVGNPDFVPNPEDSTLTVGSADAATIAVRVYAFDEEGNYDFCEVSILADPDPDCFGIISGVILTRNAETVADVEVNINNEYLAISQADGTYIQGMLDRQQTYTVVPFRNDDHSNGVKTIDMIILLKHLLGIDLMENPYQLIAADIDNSGSITDNDFTLIQQLILGNIDAFPTNTSWRFIDADYVFPAPTNPWLESFPEIINIGNLLTNATDVDFVGVKIGDLDNSAESNAQVLTDRHLAGTYELYTPDLRLKAGETYRIPIRVPTPAQLLGLQGTLQLTDATITSIEAGLLSADQIGLEHQQAGLLTFSWASLDKRTDDVLFTIEIRAAADALLSDVLQLNSRQATAEAYLLAEGQNKIEGTIAVHDLKLAFLPETAMQTWTGENGFEVFQNRPNPFRDETRIGFYLPGPAVVNLTIHDVNGRALTQLRGEYAAGYNSLSLTRTMLQQQMSAGGVLSYTLTATPLPNNKGSETTSYSQTKRMIVIK